MVLKERQGFLFLLPSTSPCIPANTETQERTAICLASHKVEILQQTKLVELRVTYIRQNEESFQNTLF